MKYEKLNRFIDIKVYEKLIYNTKENTLKIITKNEIDTDFYSIKDFNNIVIKKHIIEYIKLYENENENKIEYVYNLDEIRKIMSTKRKEII